MSSILGAAQCRPKLTLLGGPSMTSAKNYTVGLVLAVTLLVAANVRADYSVQIQDTNIYNDNVNLYQLFNNYFAAQLGENTYESSNALYLDRGVDPTRTWTTSGSYVVGAFKVAALGHALSIYDTTTGNTNGNVYSLSGTQNIGKEGGITDLGSQGIGGIPDGVKVGFELDAYNGNTMVFSWSSNPSDNDDGQVHMIAFDITDLYNEKYGTDNSSVYMFAWEDLHLNGKGGNPADWDYQDFVVIMTNLHPDNVVPEPATLAVIGLGLVGLGIARRRMKK